MRGSLKVGGRGMRPYGEGRCFLASLLSKAAGAFKNISITDMQRSDFLKYAREFKVPVVTDGEIVPQTQSAQHSSPVYVLLYPDKSEFASEAHFLVDYAQTLLKYYNKKNGTHYKLVQSFGTRGRLHYRRCASDNLYHCGFKARASCDSSVKIFFAEMKMCGGGPMVVYFCNAIDVDSLVGCEICDAKISGHFSPTHILQGPRGSRWQETDEQQDYRGLAGKALTYYNELHDTNYLFMRYELVCTRFFDMKMSHFNFVAKSGATADGASSKLFFAEIDLSDQEENVNFCCIIDGQSTICCSLCKTQSEWGDIYHPLEGNWFGRSELVERGGVGETKVRTCMEQDLKMRNLIIDSGLQAQLQVHKNKMAKMLRRSASL